MDSEEEDEVTLVEEEWRKTREEDSEAAEAFRALVSLGKTATNICRKEGVSNAVRRVILAEIAQTLLEGLDNRQEQRLELLTQMQLERREEPLLDRKGKRKANTKD